MTKKNVKKASFLSNFFGKGEYFKVELSFDAKIKIKIVKTHKRIKTTATN